MPTSSSSRRSGSSAAPASRAGPRRARTWRRGSARPRRARRAAAPRRRAARRGRGTAFAIERRQLVGRRGEQLGDVERVAAGGGVHVVGVLARERRDRAPPRGARARGSADVAASDGPWTGCPGGASPSRQVSTSSTGSEPIRRASSVITSSVASSAQCTSSSTSTVGRGGSASSSSRRRWISCGDASAASACSSVATRFRRGRGSPRAAAGSRGRRRCRRARASVARGPRGTRSRARSCRSRLTEDDDDAAVAPRRRLTRLREPPVRPHVRGAPQPNDRPVPGEFSTGAFRVSADVLAVRTRSPARLPAGHRRPARRRDRRGCPLPRLPGRARGGFTGVDVFFVISGYLISRIIWRGLDEGASPRLVLRPPRAPPLPRARARARGDARRRPLALPAGRLRDARQGRRRRRCVRVQPRALAGRGLLHRERRARPLTHLWSLAVEEQFYLVFPLLLLATRRSWRLTGAVLALLAAASFAWNVATVGSTDPAAAFYLLPSRFWELALGALLAFVQLSGRDPSGGCAPRPRSPGSACSCSPASGRPRPAASRAGGRWRRRAQPSS